MAPSLTLQYFSTPSQPVRSLPLKKSFVSSATAAALSFLASSASEVVATLAKPVRAANRPPIKSVLLIDFLPVKQGNASGIAIPHALYPERCVALLRRLSRTSLPTGEWRVDTRPSTR